MSEGQKLDELFVQGTTNDVLARLKSSHAGLRQTEAARRLAQWGPNILTAKPVRWWQMLLRQFASSFIYLLFAAALVSLLLGQLIDAALIAAFILVNALLGFFQEFRSEQSLKLLQAYVARLVRVRRGGREAVVSVDTIVSGDIVILEAGDRIPADIRFLVDYNVSVDEEVLTGESVPVVKYSEPVQSTTEKNVIGYAGTTLVSGRAEGVVLATGGRTVLGGLAQLTVETNKPSGFELGLQDFSRFILRLVVITLVLVFLVNIVIKGTGSNTAELLVFSIALAVSVIPEALPLVTTFAFSRGAVRLAKRKVVVRRLSAIQDLGSIEILCSDKTGTLTENKLTLVEVLSDDAERTILMATLGGTYLESRAVHLVNPFDEALLQHIDKEDREYLDTYEKRNEIPFDPARRRNSAIVTNDSERIMVVRGAAEHIVPFCKNVSAAKAEKIKMWHREQGALGRRLLVIAQKKPPQQDRYSAKDEEQDLYFLGVISFVDPIKPTTKRAIQTAEQLGVKVKIITGDGPEVAGAVGHEVGLIKNPADVLTGAEFEQMTFWQQHEAAHKYAVFARISPEQKYAILELLQERHQVGFLGEGVNDAPALKIANVALAVQSSVDVAREASDVILLQKNLLTIVEGIREGREIFANVVKYIKATIAANFGNFYAVAVASLLLDFLPMLPVQILLVNLLSDLPMVSVATDTVDATEVQKPRQYDIKGIMFFATILGIASSVFDFLVFGLFYRQGEAVLQTSWFITSIVTELVFLFSIRTKHPFFRTHAPSFALAGISVAVCALTLALPFSSIGQKLFRFTPLTATHLIIIASLILAYFVTTEVVKLLYYRLLRTKPGQTAMAHMPDGRPG